MEVEPASRMIGQGRGGKEDYSRGTMPKVKSRQGPLVLDEKRISRALLRKVLSPAIENPSNLINVIHIVPSHVAR